MWNTSHVKFILWWLSTKIFVSNDYFCTWDKVPLSFLSNTKQQEWTAFTVLLVLPVSWTKVPWTSHNSVSVFYSLPNEKHFSLYITVLWNKQINEYMSIYTSSMQIYRNWNTHLHAHCKVCVCEQKNLWYYSNFRMLNIVNITLFSPYS